MVRDVLLEVYANPGTGHRVGFAQVADRMIIATAADATHKGGLAEISPTAGIASLAKSLRAGYVKTGQRMYFSRQTLSFSITHPELGGDWLIAAMTEQPSRILDAVAGVAKQLPTEFVFREEVEHWIAWQAHHQTYVVAADDSPLWSLLLAQVCMQNGWALQSQPANGRLPDQLPSSAPDQWAQWLAPSFSKQSITDSLRALGWTFEHIIISGMNSFDEGNLLAYL